MKNKKKQLIKMAGICLAIIIIGFMVQQFFQNWQDIKPYLANMNPWIMLAAVVIYMMAFLATGYNWSYILWTMDSKHNRKEYLNIHMVSALARYIPGGIWNIVGKALMCTEKEVEKSATTASMILEYVFQIISSGLFCVFFIPVLIREVLTPPLMAAALIGVVVLIVLLPWGVRLGTRLLGKLFREDLSSLKLNNNYVYKILIRYILVWLLTGVGLIVLVKAFKPIEGMQGLYLVLSYPVSWVAGFLSPSPNGMGIREGVLSLLLGSRYEYTLLLLITLTTRIWTIMGEAAAFLCFKLYYILTAMLEKRKEIKKETEKISADTQGTVPAEQILFITTKNLDYLRNTQEIRLLKEKGYSLKIIGSNSKYYFIRMGKVYWRLLWLSNKRYSTVFIGFLPQLVLPFWYWKFKKKRIVIDFFISLYDTIVFDRKKVKETSFLAKIIKQWDAYTIHLAEIIIADTRAHGAYFKKEFGLGKAKLNILYLEADQKIYYEKKINRPEKWKKQYLVLYFGSILPLQGVDIVLKSAQILKEKSEIHFIIIGPVKEKLDVTESDTITYVSWLSQQELSDYINMADLCLAGHFNNKIHKAERTIPGKAYIYRACGKPMILGDNPANKELFDKNMEGIYYVEMGNPQALAEEILRIKENTNEINHSDTVL